jgi:hypothetical protein
MKKKSSPSPMEAGLISKVSLSSVIFDLLLYLSELHVGRGRRGQDRMVVGFTTTYAISTYQH